MAKKNSSKTATEKAIQSSEPKVTTYRGWKGVNYADAPLTWEPLETGAGKFRQSDLPSNFLMVQNNLVTTPTLGIETRPDSEVIGALADDSLEFTGVAAVYESWLFAVVLDTETGNEDIYYHELGNPSSLWTVIEYVGSNPWESEYTASITEIGFFEGYLVAAVNGYQECIALGKIDTSGNTLKIMGMDWEHGTETLENKIVNTPRIEDPVQGQETIGLDEWAYLEAVGMEYNYNGNNDDAPVRLEVVYCYTNRMGSTLASREATIYVEYSPALWSSSKYLKISSRKPGHGWDDIYDPIDPFNPPEGTGTWIDPHAVSGTGITGIDFYARENENVDFVFIGHIDIETTSEGSRWVYDWLGNMTDTSQWQNSQLQIPTENTTLGPTVAHFTNHDSRMYFWGQRDKPYRLYIGGNPGAEFSIARGLGGAWVDIEPGSGYNIAGTAKWKTVQGANIVTIMCGNHNTNKVKRFNLIETNTTLTNEISYKNYMYEEVSNVVGCNSRWGYGVFDDGLYSLSRYGLMLTTMAMEYNSQMKNQDVSAPIKPIFIDHKGNSLDDGRLVCIDGVIYIALSNDIDEHFGNVILCYDINLQSWYTFTHDQDLDSDDDDDILHIFPVDSDKHTEGLGTVTASEIRVYPTAGYVQDASLPKFQVLLETGELMPKMPKQTFDYVEQLEFRFDYFVGPNGDASDPWNRVYIEGQPTYCQPATILIEGVDYYGRQFTIEKKLNLKSRGHHGVSGEQRSHVEWVRIGKHVESMRIRIKGHARFRLTHIVNKMFTNSDRIGTPYGFDARDTYYNRHGGETKIHHYINDYNNLRRAVVS